MADVVRRSSRRSRRRIAYEVGDIVELVRGDIAARGELKMKASDDQWLVAIDGFPEDELVSVDDLGSVVEKEEKGVSSADQGEGKNSDNSSGGRQKKKPTRASSLSSKNGRGSRGGNSGGSSAEEGSETKTTRSRGPPHKSVSFEDTTKNGSGPPSPSSDADKKGNTVSDREERSRRRQAMVMEEAIKKPSVPVASSKRPLAGPVVGALKKQKPAANEQDVVKVHLKTGTLVFYRGTHRHVKFVRKS